MRSRLALALGLLASAGCAAVRAPDAPLAPATPVERAAPGQVSESELVERALPAVVLLLNTHADGKVTYGAGLIVQPGLVLTSQHVVADANSLGAMLYRPERPGYTPMDGGLSRYLFENQADVVTAHVVGGDATSDLAVVRIDADTSRVPALAIAEAQVKPGDRVLALGHPQETVWSFTAGVVGAIQQGAIQHDAAIGQGSSGGPLLNARGEVVGINVAKVVSEARGLAFARPIAFASRYLGDRAGVAQRPLDLSTPEASAVSCWRGQELGRVDVGDCFDWEFGWAEFQKLGADAMRLADPGARAKIRAYLDAPDRKQQWIEQAKRHVAGYFVDAVSTGPHPGPVGRKPDASPVRPLPRELVDAKARADKDEAELLEKHPELRGIHADLDDPAHLQAHLKLGIRAGRSAKLGDKAWVELVGRNADGTLYRFSELYAKVGDKWLQRSPITPADEAKLPPGFAPPLESSARHRLKKLAWLLGGNDIACMGPSPNAPASPGRAGPPPALATPSSPASETPASSAPDSDRACTSSCAHGNAGELL